MCEGKTLKIPEIFWNVLTPGKTVGLIGVGAFGTRLAEEILRRGGNILLCDPPRAALEAEEIGEHFFGLWGNGMGGCEYTGRDLHPFLPLWALLRAEILAVQVPLQREGPEPTVSLITREFLMKCRPDVKVFCFSSPEVVSPSLWDDPRIIFA